MTTSKAICFVCCTNVGNNQVSCEDDSRGGFGQFLQFAISYLKIPSTVLYPFIVDGDNRCKMFCNGCEKVVQTIWKSYLELLQAQLRLSWKLGELDKLLQTSHPSKSDKFEQLEKLADNLGISDAADLKKVHELLSLKCNFMSQQLLPSVVVTRSDTPPSPFDAHHLQLEEDDENQSQDSNVMLEHDDFDEQIMKKEQEDVPEDSEIGWDGFFSEVNNEEEEDDHYDGVNSDLVSNSKSEAESDNSNQSRVYNEDIEIDEPDEESSATPAYLNKHRRELHPGHHNQSRRQGIKRKAQRDRVKCDKVKKVVSKLPPPPRPKAMRKPPSRKDGLPRSEEQFRCKCGILYPTTSDKGRCPCKGPHCCNVCGREFARKDVMARHRKLHEKNKKTSEKQFAAYDKLLPLSRAS